MESADPPPKSRVTMGRHWLEWIFAFVGVAALTGAVVLFGTSKWFLPSAGAYAAFLVMVNVWLARRDARKRGSGR